MFQHFASLLAPVGSGSEGSSGYASSSFNCSGYIELIAKKDDERESSSSAGLPGRRAAYRAEGQRMVATGQCGSKPCILFKGNEKSYGDTSVGPSLVTTGSRAGRSIRRGRPSGETDDTV